MGVAGRFVGDLRGGERVDNPRKTLVSLGVARDLW